MNRPMLKKVFPITLALATVFALCGAKAMQQDAPTAQAPSQPGDTQAGGQHSDGQIEMDVVHALDASNALKNDLITAATVEGDVTLSGTVSSEASKELAESIVTHVAGVIKVTNNLNVGNPQQAQDTANDANAGAQQAADDSDAQAQPPQGTAPAPQDGTPRQQQPADQAQAPSMAPPQGSYPPPPPGRPQYSPYPPPPGSYPPPGYGYSYPPQQPPAPRYQQATGPVTVPQGTLMQLRTSEMLDEKRAKDGTQVQFTLIRDVAVGGVLAIPRGATVHGVVTESKQAGTLGGAPELALRLTSLDLGGQNYPIESDQFKVRGPNKAGHTAGNAIGGAILGAIIGGAIDRGPGAAIGAAAGAGAGTAASAATPGPHAWIPAEALVTFHLSTPITVTPVSEQEAARLAQGLYSGGPQLYRRSYYGYPYGYPPVYYRPYFISGGYYYWR